MSDRSLVRVIWLVQQASLAELDLPSLRALGFEIFEPNTEGRDLAAPENAWPGLTVPLEDKLALAKARFFERDRLKRHEWWLINKHFAAVVLETDAHLEAFARYFGGRIVLRRYSVPVDRPLSDDIGARPPGRPGELLAAIQSGPFHRWAPLRSRLVAATVTPSRPRQDFREHYVPIALPNDRPPRPDSRSSPGALATIVMPTDPVAAAHYGGALRTSPDLRDRSLVRVVSDRAYRRDPSALTRSATLFDGDDDVIETAPVLIDPSTDPGIITRPVLDAVAADVPLIYCEGGLIASLVGSGGAGAAATPQATPLAARQIMSDPAFRKRVLADQRILREAWSSATAQAGWVDVMGDLDEAFPFAPRRAPYRIVIVCPPGEQPADLARARRLAELLREGAAVAGVACEVSTAAESDPPDTKTAEALRIDVDHRRIRWLEVSSDQMIWSELIEGRLWRPHQTSYLVADDGAGYLQDCTHLIAFGANFDPPLGPVRPYICWLNAPPPSDKSESVRTTLAQASAIAVVERPRIAEGGLKGSAGPVVSVPETIDAALSSTSSLSSQQYRDISHHAWAILTRVL